MTNETAIDSLRLSLNSREIGYFSASDAVLDENKSYLLILFPKAVLHKPTCVWTKKIKD